MVLMMLIRWIRIEVLVNLVVAAGLLVCSAWRYLVSSGSQGAAEGKHICQKVRIGVALLKSRRLEVVLCYIKIVYSTNGTRNVAQNRTVIHVSLSFANF